MNNPGEPAESGRAGAVRRSVWRALANRNFALYFAGQGVSLVGTWLQQTTMTWLVYRRTHSAWLLGVIGFAGQLPSLLLAPFAGVWADRWNRHRALMVTQVLAMIQAFALAWLAWSGTIATWHLVALSAFLGCVSAVDITVRQAFVSDLVAHEGNLANAIALNSALTNGARLLGPALAGLMIPLLGEPRCFFINGASYAAVILALSMMDILQRPSRFQGQDMRRDILEGITYAVDSVPIRAILQLVALVSLVGLPYTVLLPAFASDVLQGGSRELGFLMAASGLGATGSAIYLASRQSVIGLGSHIASGAAIFGLSLIALSACGKFWTAMVAMMFGGYGMMIQFAASNTIIQLLVDEDKRGRVMSLYLMAFMGMMPLGSLLGGALADRVGVAATLRVCGALCVLASLVFTRRLPGIRLAARPILNTKRIVGKVGDI